MLDTDTKRRIDTARDILVGKVPDPKSQVEQITIALIYKFMDDMDAESEEFGGKRKFFANEFARYGWAKLMRSGLGGHETLNLYAEAIAKMPENPGIPLLFRDIFKNAYLPYRDPETLRAFLKIIDEFNYDHSERLGDAYEYLLSILGSQGNAGQFRTPRHIIDFIVAIINPKKNETVLDPACGSAGFLISSYKHILRNNSSKPSPRPSPTGRGSSSYRGGFEFAGLVQRARELRMKQTEAESLLWELLRDRQLDNAKFRRQHQFGEYICDFFCHEAKLVVECDGSIHDTPNQQKHDQRRDAYLKSQGLTVLHFQNDRVLNDTAAVIEDIANQLPSPTGRGAGDEGEVASMPGDLLTPDEKGRLAQNFKGYDIDPLMVRLSMVNMYLHGFADPHIAEYDTLTSLDKWNENADVILANPPFMSPKGGIKPHNRFSVQSKRSEVLFVDYMAEHLTTSGRAGIIVPEGIIFQSQTAYKQLRKMLVENYLVAVVSLPAGVFNPYSGVKTSILILDKTLARKTDTIAFFKVENDGYGLGAQRREIEKNDLPETARILKEWLNHGIHGTHGIPENEIPTSASASSECSVVKNYLFVAKEKIAANGDYSLSGERYREGITRNSAFPHVRLDEVARITAGNSAPQGDEYFAKGYAPFIRTSDVGAVHLSDNLVGAADKVNTKAIEKLRLELFPTGTILFPKSGASTFLNHRAVIGTPAYVSSHLACIICVESKALPKYVYSLLCQIDARDITPDQAYPSLRLNEIGAIQIPLPPLEIQKEIVTEIEGYQKVINGARAVIDNYRPHIPIHPDWPLVSLGALCSLGGTITTDVNLALPYIGADSIEANTGKLLKTATAGSQRVNGPVYEFAGERLLYSKIRPYLNKLTVVDLHGYCSSDMYPLLPDSAKVQITYLSTYILSDTFNERIRSYYERASIPKINRSQLFKTEIPLPPLATQRAIVAEIEAEQALIAANRELIARFEKKIQAVLARVWGTKK